MKKILLTFLFLISSLFSSELFKTGNKLVADGKGVIFVFESATCPYCDLLKKDFKENKEMNELAKNFNIYLIDREKEQDYIVGKTKKKETTTTLRMAFSTKNTPTITIFDKNWNRIFQLPGYAHPEQMITFMKFVKGLHEGKYKTDQWKKFLKDNGVE
ncbi:thioredoxin fold domain-containing protein [Arcobacter sp. LA11]|uniref:thioredoxin fold domain-containing protein n=1 Tax=Arcobacter sp. LA11 TaxID=1898176 RepID=UPI000934A5C4|nr:thioredoxin fold domain-containing protein [Arcobacter sp. LA11]